MELDEVQVVTLQALNTHSLRWRCLETGIGQPPTEGIEGKADSADRCPESLQWGISIRTAQLGRRAFMPQSRLFDGRQPEFALPLKLTVMPNGIVDPTEMLVLFEKVWRQVALGLTPQNFMRQVYGQVPVHRRSAPAGGLPPEQRCAQQSVGQSGRGAGEGCPCQYPHEASFVVSVAEYRFCHFFINLIWSLGEHDCQPGDFPVIAAKALNVSINP